MADTSTASGRAQAIDVASELKRPGLLAMLFADYVTQTVDKKVLIGGVFDRVAFTRDQPAAFYIYIRLKEVYSDLEVSFLDPDGSRVGTLSTGFESDQSPSSPEPNYQQVISRLEIRFDHPGVYWFEIRHKGVLLGCSPLVVLIKGDEDGSRTASTSTAN